MNVFATLVVVIASAVLLQAAIPDRAVFHTGWYNVALLALVAWLVSCTRAQVRAPVDARRSASILAIALGATILAFAGIADGLLAPDPRMVIGAPGQQVAVDDVGGVLKFPPVDPLKLNASSRPGPVTLVREAGSIAIAPQRYIGSFVLRSVPRAVVGIDAHDASGAHLTMTQPTGAVFLSPVLMMESTQRISGLALPYDSFALPAAHRIVKVVLFSAQEVAALRGILGVPLPGMLFAVDDDTDTPIPHAIAFAHTGQSVLVGGVRLRAEVFTYPAVEIVSAPSLLAIVIGGVLMSGGLLVAFALPRSP